MLDTINITIQKTNQSRLSQVDFEHIQFGKSYADHMFVADYKDGEWSGFRIVPYDYLKLSPSNSALHYGQSVFEGMKAYKNIDGEAVLFRPYDNARRLNMSAERMCIPQLPEELFMRGIKELIRIDKDWIPDQPDTSLYIRPFMFATDEYIGVRASDTYRFIIFSCPVGAYYSVPVKVKVETRFSRAFPGGTGYAKAAGNYAASLYPARQAQQQGYHQLVWTDAVTHEFIEESGTMNVMFVIGDKLITSPVGETILKGITRDSVLTIARDWGLTVEERKVSVKEVIEAAKNGILKEAFGTGTAATIAHIAVIGYEDTDYQLPEVEKRKFSNKVLKELDDIKAGKIEDRYNWMHKV